ncbi:MAG: hypothetical protein K2H34_02635, partial [Lachnospiraceae bacterium]|nr:hypothetical protein [Lachnospiraceae bacterium]
MKRYKKVIAMFLSCSMLAGLCACSKTDDYNSQTLIGQVTDINGTKITLQLGEIENGEASPEMPDGNRPQNGEAPPELPGGETGQNNEAPDKKPQDDQQTPPKMPDGNMAMGGFTAGEETVTLDFSKAIIRVESGMEMTDDGTIENITVGSILSIEFGENNTAKTVTVKFAGGGMQNGQPGGFGGSDEVTQGTSANTLDSDGKYSDQSYTSSGDDENALRVDGAKITLSGITVDKSAGSSSNTEDGDFYGMNAALLATNGADVTIEDAEITSSAQNGNGVFSYGSDTTLDISNSKITTMADNSGGIQTTGGGTTNAKNLTIETSGSSSAAIRSDRGGGTVNVNSGSYTTNGYNSPAIYSTAAITVKNADLTAHNSEALVIEGQNSIALENCTVTGNMSDTQGSSSDENVHNVMIYQSMSGDADIGTSEFSMTGGKLVSQNGDMIYTTNTHCIINLSDVEIVNQDNNGYLLRVVGNSARRGWGTAGKNGAQVEFNA